MKYTISVNQERALEAGVKSIITAHILDLLTTCSSWATPQERNGHIFYWVSRQSICRELPLLDIKPDTAYRHLKKLAELKLIDYQKDGKKDLVRLTTKGKKYHSVPSDKGQKSEDNSYVGFKSEENSDNSIEPDKNKAENDCLDVQNNKNHYVGRRSEGENEDYIGCSSENDKKHYVGLESESAKNSDYDPKKLGLESEKGRMEIRHIPNTRSIPNTNDPAVGARSKNQNGSDIRFPMHDEWQPSITLKSICVRAGFSDYENFHSNEALTEFILYWSGQPVEQTQYNWELKYFKQLKRIKANQNQPPKGERHGQPDFNAEDWL